MGMTEYEKRMVELEKKKVKILTDILKELAYMNKSDLEKMFIPREKTDTEIPESI
jgi:hypothetical protein